MIAGLEKELSRLSDADRDKILAMGESFEHVFTSPHCPAELKKKIARTIIEEVIATDADANTLHFVIHWKGGRPYGIHDAEAPIGGGSADSHGSVGNHPQDGGSLRR